MAPEGAAVNASATVGDEGMAGPRREPILRSDISAKPAYIGSVSKGNQIQRRLTSHALLTDPRKIAARVYELFDEGDVAGLDGVLDQDLVDHNPVPGTASGIDGMRALVGAVRDGVTEIRHVEELAQLNQQLTA